MSFEDSVLEFSTTLRNKLEVKGFRILETHLYHQIKEMKSIFQMSTRVILPMLTTRQQSEFRMDVISTLDDINLALLETCYFDTDNLINRMRKISNILQHFI
jgi:hypothetical protein